MEGLMSDAAALTPLTVRHALRQAPRFSMRVAFVSGQLEGANDECPNNATHGHWVQPSLASFDSLLTDESATDEATLASVEARSTATGASTGTSPMAE
jgi:hypothetical protein